MNYHTKVRTVMILTIITLTLTIPQLLAQASPFIGLSIDPTMLVNGPGYSYEETSSINLEFRAGVETKKLRLGMAFEIHEVINYTKWSYAMLDYKVQNFPFKNFKSFAGIEISSIRRVHEDAHWSQPDNYIRVKNNPLLLGANAEMQYKHPKLPVSIGIGINVFQSEEDVRKYKYLRWDVMGSIYIPLW